MKLGGLFSGIGGFELAWTQLGHEVAWMCEIDRNARKVLQARFPGVPIYEDVEQLDPAEVEAVDVLTGGSPCQGFSVAGTRSGLEHGESRLFADYIRIMEGLANRGLKWALWENVPGVLSIQNDDGERTFEHVVTALVGGTVPVRLGQGRWNTGLADGGGRAVAWRVLDSRYFGVAQRRRRVFACVAFGGVAADRAGRALLAKSQSVSGDSAAGDTKRKTVAGNVAGCVGMESSNSTVIRKVRSSEWVEDTTGSTLAARDYKDTGDLVVSATVTSKWAKGVGGPSNSTTETANIVVQPAWWDGGDTADSLTATSDNQRMPDKQRLQAVVAPLGVRRLTPVECERLQAFPDGWTEPAGSDSARYKALGNAVTVNTVRWVLGRMVDQS
jgi:DNA (cytosine-5)-methyltransferase 1